MYARMDSSACGPVVAHCQAQLGPRESQQSMLADVPEVEPALIGLEAVLHSHSTVHDSSRERFMPTLLIPRAVASDVACVRGLPCLCFSVM
jgi:hypothetical protein